MKPSIGIVTCGFMGNRQFVTNPYIQSVRYSGGLPLILPLVRSDAVLDQYIGLCSGFLFCGGEDITPLLFGQEPQKGNGQTSITVDLFQIRLMKKVLASRKPVLAICRGMQVINVLYGGNMIQDIHGQTQTTQAHRGSMEARDEPFHRVYFTPGSRLYDMAGQDSLLTNSYHHQAIDRLAPGPVPGPGRSGRCPAGGTRWGCPCTCRRRGR